MEMVA